MKLIFKHIPKTAGLSIKEIIPEQTLFLGHGYYDNDYKHLYFHINNFQKKFVFSFVRNPYDRIVSAFFYLNNGGNNPKDVEDKKKYIEQYKSNFTDFVKNAFPDIFNQLHFMPQYTWIYLKNINLCNYVGKFENLENDICELSQMFSGFKTDIPFRNTSDHKFYKEYYNDETQEIIYKQYRRDFILFDYKKDL